MWKLFFSAFLHTNVISKSLLPFGTLPALTIIGLFCFYFTIWTLVSDFFFLKPAFSHFPQENGPSAPRTRFQSYDTVVARVSAMGYGPRCTVQVRVSPRARAGSPDAWPGLSHTAPRLKGFCLLFLPRRPGIHNTSNRWPHSFIFHGASFVASFLLRPPHARRSEGQTV